MAETTPSPEEQALRRRARRRLVGAVALALLAVVILPMVFDPEPRPMANDVDIRIPEPSTPFPTAMDKPAAPAPSMPAEVQPDVKPPATPEAAPAKAPVAVKGDAANKPAPANSSAKKPEPAKSAPAPEKTAATGFYLQLGSFSSEANAKKMVDKAHAVGFKASVQAVSGQYKVRIGPIADKAKTLDYQGQLKAKGLASVVVEP